MLIQNLYLDLCLYRTYTYHRLMFIRESRRSYRTYSYAELILITDLYLLRNYTYGRLILIGSYTYSSQILFLFGFLVYYTELIHVRILISSLCLYRGVYTCSKIPLGITEITKRILDLRNLILYGSTRKYYLINYLI